MTGHGYNSEFKRVPANTSLVTSGTAYRLTESDNSRQHEGKTMPIPVRKMASRSRMKTGSALNRF